MENKYIEPKIFLIDFDGTCTANNFPHIGKEIGAVPVLKRLIDSGHKLILFTMRSDNKNKTNSTDPLIPAMNGQFLTEAVNWFKKNDIPLYGIQTDPNQKTWTDSPKAFGDYIIDDTCLFAPLIYDETMSSKPFIDWVKVEVRLEQLGLI